MNHNEGVIWPTAPIKVIYQSQGLNTIRAVSADGLGLLSWLFKDKLIAALDAEIDAISDDKNALSDEQRDARLAKLHDDLLDAERAECALIEGTAIAHRTDTDARALLAIVGPAPSED